MKKILMSVLLLLGGLCCFTACEDDTDSNPTLVQPKTFVLNTPAYAEENLDLASSESLHFSWSQPDYGFPVVANYFLQLSVNGNFSVSVAEAQAQAEAGAEEVPVPDYISAEDPNTVCSRDFSAAAVARMLQQLCKWPEAEVPATQKVYARIYAEVPVAGGMPSVAPIASNVVTFNVVPYYVELKDALPELWYLIGDAIGDGKWANNPSAVGTSIVPMNVKKNYAYDKKTGQGEIVFTGYFEAAKGFKLIQTPGDWTHQWGKGADGFVKDDGGSGNINVEADGYYTLTLDTKNNVLKIEAAEAPAQTYDMIYAIGDFNGWTVPGNEMTKVNVNVAKNHVWSYVLDASAADTGFKFKINSWDVNWGAENFPYGIGTNGGKNIPVPAGKYMVIFNDITGAYNFMPL